MKIDVGAIEGYAEMTAEQKLAALEAFEYDDHAAELEKLKAANSKANSEAAEWKRKHNALLSEDEQKQQTEAEEKKSLLDKLAALEKKNAISEYTAKYLALGYDKELAADTAAAIADGNMDKVFANGEKHRQAMEQKIKADLMKQMPQPEGNHAGGDDGKSLAIRKAKELAQAKTGDKSYKDIINKYKT